MMDSIFRCVAGWRVRIANWIAPAKPEPTPVVQTIWLHLNPDVVRDPDWWNRDFGKTR